MSIPTRKALFTYFNPLVQTARFRGKINLRRPKVPHFERAVLIELTKPKFLSKLKDIPKIDLCKNFRLKNRGQEENPLQNIIAGELRDRFFESKLIAFFHWNPMSADDQYKANVAFFRENMFFKNYGRDTMSIAVNGTKFETILEFYVSKNMTVFSPELKLKELLKINRRFPQLVLMATVCEGQLLSKDETMKLSLIPNLQAAQSSLVQTINTAAVTLHSQLNQHQQALVSNLEARMKQLEESEEK